MTRKRKTENDLLVTPPASAAPARRKTTVARTRARRTGEQVDIATAAEPATVAITGEEPVAALLEPSYQDIAQLAYSYWESRGCHGGSPEEDWLRAEQELRARAATA